MDSSKEETQEEKEVSARDMQVGGSHYKDMKIQPSDFIMANNLSWYAGNAVKYICRHSSKGGKIDLEKAIHYIQLLIEHEYPEVPEVPEVLKKHSVSSMDTLATKALHTLIKSRAPFCDHSPVYAHTEKEWF